MPEIDTLAKTLWDYLKLNQTIEPCDCIFVLGSHDATTAEYAIELYKKGYGQYIIFSGGVFQEQLNQIEAEGFAEMALKAGIPQDKVIIENKAMNTGENFIFTRELLEKTNLPFTSFLIVQKPYMERRVYAVAMKRWPDKKVIVTSQPISYEDYISGDIPKDKILNTMVGDLQRIKVYGENGLQMSQQIPAHVFGGRMKN